MLKALHDIAVSGATLADEDLFIEQVLQITGQIFHLEYYGIFLLDEVGENLICHPSYRARASDNLYQIVPVTTGIVGRVARTGKVVRVDDVTQDLDYLVSSDQIRSLLCAPLVVDGDMLGVLNLESAQTSHFTDEDELLLTTIASQVGTSLARMRLDKITKEQTRRLAGLHEITQTSVAELAPKKMLQTLLEQLVKMFAADAGYCALWHDDDKHSLSIVVTYGEVTNNAYAHIGYVLLSKSVLKNGRCQIIQKLAHTPSLPTQIRPYFQENTVMILPLIVNEQKQGTFLLTYKQYRYFHDDEINLGDQAAKQVSLVMLKSRLWQETQLRATEMETLFQISSELRTAPHVEAMLTLILEHTTATSQSDCSLQLVAPPAGDLLIPDFDVAGRYISRTGATRWTGLFFAARVTGPDSLS